MKGAALEPCVANFNSFFVSFQHMLAVCLLTSANVCCSFAALKALMPSQEKMDKATFLGSTVEYIKQLQVCGYVHTSTMCLGMINLLLQYASDVAFIGRCVWLQGTMQQLVSIGAVSKLPEEAQWNIRVLLPRKAEPSVAPFTVPAARVANPAVPAVDPAATNAALLGMLLNQPNQMAATSQQVPQRSMRLRSISCDLEVIAR